MKKIIAMILALSVVLAFAACAKEDPIIETGLTIEDISAVYKVGEIREYKETKISGSKKNFSFKNESYYKVQGVLSGDNVVEFSVYMTNIAAKNYNDFLQIILKGTVNFDALGTSEYKSLRPIVYVRDLYDALGGDSETLDPMSLIRVITDKEVLKTDNWRITADLNISEKSVTINVEYAK